MIQQLEEHESLSSFLSVNYSIIFITIIEEINNLLGNIKNIMSNIL